MGVCRRGTSLSKIRAVRENIAWWECVGWLSGRSHSRTGCDRKMGALVAQLRTLDFQRLLRIPWRILSLECRGRIISLLALEKPQMHRSGWIGSVC